MSSADTYITCSGAYQSKQMISDDATLTQINFETSDGTIRVSGSRCKSPSEISRVFVSMRDECFVLLRATVAHVVSQLFNLLKPTGYVMHHQFNIQQLYILPTLYLCVLYLSENEQRLVPLAA